MTNDEFGVFAKQVAEVGSAFYFHPDTLATGKASGLDGFRFYFVGRGGVLGDVEADVVHSAFGYFEPALFATMWNSAKEIIPARDGARLYMGCNHALGRAKLADVAGLDAFCEAAGAVNDAIDPTGLALYAVVAAEPVPDDLPPGRSTLRWCSARHGAARTSSPSWHQDWRRGSPTRSGDPPM